MIKIPKLEKIPEDESITLNDRQFNLIIGVVNQQSEVIAQLVDAVDLLDQEQKLDFESGKNYENVGNA